LREKKQINSRQDAKYAKVFGVRTNKNTKFSAISAPLREKKTNKSRQGAKHAKVYGLKTSQALEVLGGPGDLAKVNP